MQAFTSVFFHQTRFYTRTHSEKDCPGVEVFLAKNPDFAKSACEKLNEIIKESENTCCWCGEITPISKLGSILPTDDSPLACDKCKKEIKDHMDNPPYGPFPKR